MKKLKKYNEKEIKALVIEYNALANERAKTTELAMTYRLEEVKIDQNFILPYIQLCFNATKSGRPERLYLEWSGELVRVEPDTSVARLEVIIKGKSLTLTYDDKYELIDVSGDCIGDITDTINGNVYGDIGGEVHGDVEGKVFGSINGFGQLSKIN